MQRYLRVLLGYAAALTVVTGVGTASAQGLIGGAEALEELRAEQAQLFERLIDEPDNLDLMFEYAQLSIQLEDYEAAISTLERMLIYRQDLYRVRLELGVAYFRLGSYAASELYFDQVLENPRTPEEVRANIKRYKDAIAGRTQRHQFSALATAGLTYSTNATQGPDDDLVLLAGNPANLVSGNEEDDVGVRVVVNMSHIYDLQQADDDYWRTDVNLFTLNYFETDEGDVGLVRVRTGPRLSLDAQQFGPKMRPYIEGQYLTSEQRGLFASYGVGAELTDTLSPLASVYGDVGMRYRNYFRKEFSDEDQFTFYSLAGLAYLPARDVIVRTTGIFEVDGADERWNTNVEVGLRLAAEYQYESGVNWVDRKWSTSAFVEGRARFFDEPDPIVDPNRRRYDLDLRSGIRQVFALKEGLGIQLDVDALVRESNIRNFDLNNISTTLSLQYRY